MMMMMMKRARWLALTVTLVWFMAVGADDFHGYNARTGEGKVHKASCLQLCAQLDIKDGCQRAPLDQEREEVIVMTNGSETIINWKWDTITMVVSAYSNSISKTGLTSCVAHSKGKRFGLRELVPGSKNISIVLGNVEQVKQDFIRKITNYQTLLMADHVVFDLLLFFHLLEQSTAEDTSKAIASMGSILSAAAAEIRRNYDSEVFCVVPWEPPCPESDCSAVRMLLGNCQVLVMSPDSYLPTPEEGMCTAQATIPVSMFLYGVDRYIALRAQPNVQGSIVAGIPWHGYTYKCDELTGDTCKVRNTAGKRCFDDSNRRRHSLSHIHSMSIPRVQVKMDEITKGIYYNVNDSAQMWFENFTTLFIKYHLVQDLQLRGLSIWYGEDLVVDMSVDDTDFVYGSWDFLTLHVLHKAVYNPVKTKHVYADTVAGVGVGCLLLGTALGVIFTCIAFRRKNFQRMNRPFKLDEVDDGFRDDEGF